MKANKLIKHYFAIDKAQKDEEKAQLESLNTRQKREVEAFLSSLKNKDDFIFRLISNSKAFLNYHSKLHPKQPMLFSEDELMRNAPENCLF